MSSTSTLRTPSPSPSPSTRRRPVRRPTSRLAGSLAVAGMALALAACGGGSDSAEDVAEAAGSDIVKTLEEYDETHGGDDAPTAEEARESFNEWLDSDTGSSADDEDAAAEESPADDDAEASGDPAVVGDCLVRLPKGSEDTDAELPVGDCAAEHAADIFYAAPLGHLGEEYPVSQTAIFDAATEGCGEGYLNHFGAPVIDTGIAFNFVFPTRETWEDGDTDVLCYAYPTSMATYTGELQVTE